MARIYLDHAATTPLLPEVAEAMSPWMTEEFGNPSSLYAEGRKAREAVDASRAILAENLGCLFAEVTFTSSGTEAANLAIIGAALGNQDPRRNRVLLSAAEHHCVLETRPLLERLGYHVEVLPVDRTARIRLDHLEAIMAEDVLLVSAMYANNEVGSIQPIAEIAETVHKLGALLFSDAVQTFCTLEWTADSLGADLIAVSAHKINGPKGAGALYVRAGTKLKPLIYGGGQERELRAGTENVAGIVGFAEAVKHYADDTKREAKDAFVRRLSQILSGQGSTAPAFTLGSPTLEDETRSPSPSANGGEPTPFPPEPGTRGGAGNPEPLQLSGHAHLRFLGISAETMLIRLDRMGISASSGAACSSGSLEPSHVLKAMGYSESEAKEGLRFTFGRSSTVAEAIRAAEIVAETASRIRSGC